MARIAVTTLAIAFLGAILARADEPVADWPSEPADSLVDYSGHSSNPEPPPVPAPDVGVGSEVSLPYCPTPVQRIFGPHQVTSQKFPTVRATGFFHLDSGWFSQDAANRATVGDTQDGLGFRRARIAAQGQVAEDVAYIMEFDFAQAQQRFVDLWMEFQGVADIMNIRVGRYRQPFGMTELTGIRELAFLERPLPFVLAPFRQTGIMAHGTAADENITWAASGYRYLSDNFGNVVGDDGGYGLATRWTMLPIYENDGEFLLHLGADYSYNDPARDVVLFASGPEVFFGQNPVLGPNGVGTLPIVVDPPFVNTGLVPTSNTNLFNLEAAAAVGGVYVQSEFRWAVLEQLNGTTDTFPGAYALARYVLTGEKLPYNRKGGVFGRIVPRNPVKFGGGGGPGAWEVAARWSWLDLNGTALPGPGRDLTDLTLGLNWYLNNHTKFQFNYIHAFLEDPVLGESDANILAIRGQLDF